MKLEMILNRISPSECDVRFYEKKDYSSNSFSHCTTMSVYELYTDWMDEANNCPENGTFIYAVQFTTYSGLVFNLDNSGYGEFTFDSLMEAIEKKFYPTMTFLEFINEHLIKNQEEYDAVIGDVDMPATLGMCEDWVITDYCKEKFGKLLDSKCKIINDTTVEVIDDIDYRIGRNFCYSVAGYIDCEEFDKLFGTHYAD